ncbi:hypothetical protein COJ02_24620 [Bacillus thuringiensis]|nr:hypothetical protein COJ02_24620 [Bacillus thuringiensis]PFR39089.1 hypothetical protein COK27_18920 [Bacillus thuringiensis]PGL28052.1 hypothetical protein CN921_05305 [Bacillus thuringiensis]
MSRECILKKVRRTREEVLNQVRFENKYVAIQELHKEKNMTISLYIRIYITILNIGKEYWVLLFFE